MAQSVATVEALGPSPWLLRRRGETGIIRRPSIVTPDLEDPYVRHQDVIERALAEVCRRHRLREEQAEEFVSAARIRLLEDDRAILRKYAGASSIRTFLAVVVARLFIDWCNSEWGRWRPTAEARRQGVVAIELERLVFRDGWGVSEAFEQVVSTGRASRADCERMWRMLPRAPRSTTLPISEVPEPAMAAGPAELLAEREQGQRTVAALERAVARLDADEQMLVHLQYWQNCTVAEIARMQALDQRELYRRFVRIREQLRQALAADGVDAAAIAGILSQLDTLP